VDAFVQIHTFLDTAQPPAERAALAEGLARRVWSAQEDFDFHAWNALCAVYLDSHEDETLRAAAAQAIQIVSQTVRWAQMQDQARALLAAQGRVGPPLESMLLRDLDQLQRHGMTQLPLGNLWFYGRDPRVLAVLDQATRHPDPTIRDTAYSGLGLLGDVHAVLAGLEDPVPDVRASAARSLGAGGMGATAEIVALERTLNDDDSEVQRAALLALRHLGARPWPRPPAAPIVPPAPPAADTSPAVPGTAADLADATAPTTPAADFAWGPFLAQWSWRLVQLDVIRDEQPDDVITSGWLGYPGATEAQLVAAEARLGRRLPPSYRAFLQVTNGWRGPEQYRFLPIEEVDLFRVNEPDEAAGLAAMALDTAGADLSEAAHRVYGADQDPARFRGAYVRTALQISAPSENFGYEVMALNPEVVTPEAEWEAWLVGSKLPGVARWPSFWDMLYGMVVTNFPEQPPDDTAGAGGEAPVDPPPA
jgi:hypothetical protein